MICAIYASTERWLPIDELGSMAAVRLSREALGQARFNMPWCYGLALYAEAESLLRTGWVP